MITTVNAGKSTSLYLPAWKVLELIPTGTSKYSRYNDPSSVIESANFSSRRVIGPFSRAFSFRLDVISGILTATQSDLSNSNVDIEQEKQRESAATYNQFIKVFPTIRAKPFESRFEDILYTSADASVSLGDDRYDPATAQSYAKVTIPDSDTNWHGVNYFDLDTWHMDTNDVWMMSVYAPDITADGSPLEVQIQVSSDTSIGSNYRTFLFQVPTLQKGYNLLTFMNFEFKLFAATYEQGRTNVRQQWINNGNMTPESIIKSVRIQCRNATGVTGATTVYLGGILTAPSGWATSAIMWQADDFVKDFFDLGAAAVIESYGWNHANAIVTGYSARGTDIPGGTARVPLSFAHEFEKNGNELLSHLREHERMGGAAGVDTAAKIKALEASQVMWKALGLNNAAQYILWPFGKYDDETITLAKARGYKLGLTTTGDEINPLIAGTNPFNMNRYVIEQPNSYMADAHLNGSIMRGTSVITGFHTPVLGGEGQNLYPGANMFYLDHLKRWCDVVAEHEAAGRCIVTTPTRFLRKCGIEPETHTFLE